MMTAYTVKAINLKTHSLGESDKILTLFSQEKGLLKLLPRGQKNNRQAHHKNRSFSI